MPLEWLSNERTRVRVVAWKGQGRSSRDVEVVPLVLHHLLEQQTSWKYSMYVFLANAMFTLFMQVQCVYLAHTGLIDELS